MTATENVKSYEQKNVSIEMCHYEKDLNRFKTSRIVNRNC